MPASVEKLLSELEAVQKSLTEQSRLLNQVRSKHNAMSNKLSKLKKQLKAIEQEHRTYGDPNQLELFK